MDTKKQTKKKGRQKKRWPDVFFERVGPDWIRKPWNQELWRDLR